MRIILFLASVFAISGCATSRIKPEAVQIFLFHSAFVNRQEAYVHGNQALFVEHRPGGESDVPHIPRWQISLVSDAELANYLSTLEALGVFSWQPLYELPPAPEGVLNICESGWYLAVISPNRTIQSEGYCSEPENFEEVLRITMELVAIGT